MTSQSPLARSGIPDVAVKSTFSSPFWRANLGDKNAHSSTNNSHSHFSITPSSSAPHFTKKICHFQPFVKLKLSKNISWGPPFAKMQKMSHFSGLGFGRLRCVDYDIFARVQPLLPNTFTFARTQPLLLRYHHFVPMQQLLPE